VAELTLRNVVKRCGAVEVIHGLDLDIKRGEFRSVGERQSMVVQVVGQSPLERGDTVRLQFPRDHRHAFNASGLALTH